MNRIPRPVAIAGVAAVAALVVGVPLVVDHEPHHASVDTSAAPSYLEVPTAAASLADTTAPSVADDDPTGTATHSSSPDRTTAVQSAALTFARAEFDTARPADRWRTAVSTLCTPELAASFADADPPNSTVTVDSSGTVPVSWLAAGLAQADVDITMDGAPRTLTVTLNDASGTWLVSDVDLSQS